MERGEAMNSQGWVKLHRQIEKNSLWLMEPFTKGQAWVDLIILANHQPHDFDVRGNVVRVERGQVGRSEDSLAERWQWSRGKVRRFIKMLETRQQIVQQKSHILSVISIVNYDEFQGNETTDSTTDEQQTDDRKTTERQQTDTNKNEKNGLEGKEGKQSPPKSPKGEWELDFETWWKLALPHKRGEDQKAPCKKKYLKARQAGLTPEDLHEFRERFIERNKGLKKKLGFRGGLELDNIKDILENGHMKPQEPTDMFQDMMNQIAGGGPDVDLLQEQEKEADILFLDAPPIERT